MGCESSTMDNGAHGHNALMRNNRKVEKVIGHSTGSSRIYENVIKMDEKVSSKSEMKIYKIITNHFFFSNFSES